MGFVSYTLELYGFLPQVCFPFVSQRKEERNLLKFKDFAKTLLTFEKLILRKTLYCIVAFLSVSFYQFTPQKSVLEGCLGGSVG